MFFTSAEEIKLLTNLFFYSQFSTSAKLPSLRIYSTCLKAETLVPSGFLSDLILKWNIAINFFHCHHKFIACLNAHIRPYSVRIGFIGRNTLTQLFQRLYRRVFEMFTYAFHCVKRSNLLIPSPFMSKKIL